MAFYSLAKPAVFVWEGKNNYTAVYDGLGNLESTIPYAGLYATDIEGDLYLSDPSGISVVKIYQPPYTGEPALLILPKGRILNFVAIDQKTDVVAVLTQTSAIGGGDSEALFYRHGEHKPCATVGYQNGVVYGFSGAFDAEGTLFADAVTPTNDSVVASISGECSATTVQVNTFSTPVHAYSFVGVDLSDHIVVQDSTSQGLGPLLVFDHPQLGVFGEPLQTVTFDSYGGQQPSAGGFANDGHIWLNFYAGGNSIGQVRPVNRYSYPAGGAPVESIRTAHDPNNVIAYPASVP